MCNLSIPVWDLRHVWPRTGNLEMPNVPLCRFAHTHNDTKHAKITISLLKLCNKFVLWSVGVSSRQNLPFYWDSGSKFVINLCVRHGEDRHYNMFSKQKKCSWVQYSTHRTFIEL